MEVMHAWRTSATFSFSTRRLQSFRSVLVPRHSSVATLAPSLWQTHKRKWCTASNPAIAKPLPPGFVPDDGSVESTRRMLGLDQISSCTSSPTTTTTESTTATASPESTSKHEEKKKTNLVGLTYQEFEDTLVERGWRVDQAKQAWICIYDRGITEFDNMLELSKACRAALAADYEIDYGQTQFDHLSADGTRKWMVGFGKSAVESVFIPETTRGTLCVSSQVGCTMSCSFCHTGTQPIERNLTAGEIVSQLMQARLHLREFPLRGTGRIVSNIVFMGQGEPGYNWRNVAKAIDIISDGRGCKIGKAKITISTSGVVPFIYRMAKDLKGVQLAISLHAVRDSLRNELVPINKQYPIAEMLEACRAHRRVAFEYVMLQGVNDSEADAHDLVKLIKDFQCVVNLIPFNAWPGSIYECSSREQIEKFADILIAANIHAPIRWPRGRDILAACGQLRTESARLVKYVAHHN
eukprot:TRINITY_DN6940_c0_g1_i4.p1 TRINITY_DN6940_c0_g1~~TRINITY_DN6940_c0_g1_i4.p1  ORF type:complete len:467 (+),score=27.59 TRINITY_DN6940_c0_g1_i4:1-1401(+)